MNITILDIAHRSAKEEKDYSHYLKKIGLSYCYKYFNFFKFQDIVRSRWKKK